MRERGRAGPAVVAVAGDAAGLRLEDRAVGDLAVAHEGEPVPLDPLDDGAILRSHRDAHPVERAEEEHHLGAVVGAGSSSVYPGHALETIPVDRGESGEPVHEVQSRSVEDDKLHHPDLEVDDALRFLPHLGGDAPAVLPVDLLDSPGEIPAAGRDAHAPVPHGHLDHRELVRRGPDQDGQAGKGAVVQDDARVGGEEGTVHGGGQTRPGHPQAQQAFDR